MKKTITTMISFFIVIFIYFYHSDLMDVIKILWQTVIDFLSTEYKGMLATIIGGLITYLYVIHVENKREIREIQREDAKDEKEKREKCTKALLSTQMAIGIQIGAVKGIEVLVRDVLAYLFLGKTLEQHLRDIPSVSEKVDKLRQLVKDGQYPINNLVSLTNYLLVHPVNDHLITLPYEIFEIPAMPLKKKIILAECAHYFNILSSCNRKHAAIALEIAHNNKIRDLYINQPFLNEIAQTPTKITSDEKERCLIVIAGTFTMALRLREMITKYLEQANYIFSQSATYIDLLGVSESIPVAKDKDGAILFNKV